MEKVKNINRKSFFTGFGIIAVSVFASRLLPFNMFKLSSGKGIKVSENPEAVKRVK